MSNTTDKRPTFTMTIKAEPGRTWLAPADVRLRGLLKAMLRQFGFKVLSIQEQPGGVEPFLEGQKRAEILRFASENRTYTKATATKFAN